MIAIAAAILLRGIADVRPEMHRLVAIEDRTAHQYDTAANQFRLGAIKKRSWRSSSINRSDLNCTRPGNDWRH